MELSEIEGFEKVSGEPTVLPELFREEVKFNGGTRGKQKHRKHVSVEAVIGRYGSNTYFRGSCWNCGETYIGRRDEKRQSLLKCPDCGETSFIYKGFFNNTPLSEYETPKRSEINQPMYIVISKYSNLNPDFAFVTADWVEDKKTNEKYNIEFVKRIS